MKLVIKVAAMFLIALLLTPTMTNALGGEGWYLVKRKNDCPGFPGCTNELDRLGCYYLDKSAYESDEKVLYLTFDAGYENGNVEKILDIMKEEDVRGAFFILSNIISKNPELIKRMHDEGHTVCNHTKNHKNLTKLTDDEIESNLKSLEDQCEKITGVKMTRYFRFPEGMYSLDAVKAVENLGYKTFFWSIAYADWDNARQPSRESAMKSLLDQTHPGGVILLHPTSETNSQILGDMIREWRRLGYRFGTLDELVSKNSNK